MIRRLEETPASRWQRIKLGKNIRPDYLYLKTRRIYLRDFDWSPHPDDFGILWSQEAFFNSEFLIEYKVDNDPGGVPFSMETPRDGVVDWGKCKYRIWRFKSKGSKYL